MTILLTNYFKSRWLRSLCIKHKVISHVRFSLSNGKSKSIICFVIDKIVTLEKFFSFRPWIVDEKLKANLFDHRHCQNGNEKKKTLRLTATPAPYLFVIIHLLDVVIVNFVSLLSTNHWIGNKPMKIDCQSTEKIHDEFCLPWIKLFESSGWKIVSLFVWDNRWFNKQSNRQSILSDRILIKHSLTVHNYREEKRSFGVTALEDRRFSNCFSIDRDFSIEKYSRKKSGSWLGSSK